MDYIAQAMNDSLGATLTVFLLSMIPIAEARFAIPFGMSMGLNPGVSLGWAFLGTSIITPILLLILIPIINALSRTRVFSKLGKFLYDKFDKKSKSLKDADGQNSEERDGQNKHKLKLSKHDLKRMGGTALFVAVPIPLTGVWTGSAVASIVKIGFVKGLVSVIAGNAVACSIITLLCWAFADYVNYITIAFFIIALIVVCALIIKLVLYKPNGDNSGEAEKAGSNSDTDTHSDNSTERTDAGRDASDDGTTDRS